MTHLFDRPGPRPSRNPSEKARMSKEEGGITAMEFNFFHCICHVKMYTLNSAKSEPLLVKNIPYKLI